MASVSKSGVFHRWDFLSLLHSPINSIAILAKPTVGTHQKVTFFFFQTATMIISTYFYMMFPSSTITRSNTPIIQEHALVDMAPAFLYPYTCARGRFGKNWWVIAKIIHISLVHWILWLTTTLYSSNGHFRTSLTPRKDRAYRIW